LPRCPQPREPRTDAGPRSARRGEAGSGGGGRQRGAGVGGSRSAQE